jgi:hypothetical protein
MHGHLYIQKYEDKNVLGIFFKVSSLQSMVNIGHFKVTCAYNQCPSPHATAFKTFNFSTLYITIPHSRLKDRLNMRIGSLVFLKKDWPT